MSKAELTPSSLYIRPSTSVDGPFVRPVTQSFPELLFILHPTAILLLLKHKSVIFLPHLQLFNGFPLSLGFSPSSLTRIIKAPHDRPSPTSPASSLTTVPFINSFSEHVLSTYYMPDTILNAGIQQWTKRISAIPELQPIWFTFFSPLTSGPIGTQFIQLRKLIVFLLPKCLPTPIPSCLVNSSFRSLLLSRLG